MANIKHIEILDEGVKAWNEWRNDNPQIKPNLRKANLEARNLEGIDFRNVDLQRAKLINADLGMRDNHDGTFSPAMLDAANLRDADLSFAKLTFARMPNADLSYTDLTYTILRAANLQNADFSRANVRQTDFTHAELDNANFTFAEFWRPTFGNNNLAKVRGLDTIIHAGPSYLGIDTIYRSFYKLPKVFLSGCGIPDELVTFLPSLLGAEQVIQFYSCFISYSTKDEEFAKRLYSRMRDEHLRVWFAPEDIKGGQKLYEQIEQAIQMHDRLLLVLSENSISSEWVLTETRNVRKIEIEEGRRKLFPIRLIDFDVLKKWKCFDGDGGKDLAAEVREYFIPDFSNWKDHDSFEEAFAKLLRDLRAQESG